MTNDKTLLESLRPLIYDNDINLVRILDYVSYEIKGIVRKYEYSPEISFCIQKVSKSNYILHIMCDEYTEVHNYNNIVNVINQIYNSLYTYLNLFSFERN